MGRPHLRAAVPGDAAPLTELSRRTFLATYAVHNTAADMELYLAQSLTETQWRDVLERSERRVLLLEDGSALVGYAEVRQGFTPSSVQTEVPVELSRLYVSAERQGEGLGAVLMQGCIEEALARGGTGLWLGVWQKNGRAIAFYQRSGFTIVGSQIFPLGRDLQEDWVMLRPLP
ncbi:MAG TPA: GNAT family N-acetyltransferase [Gemmatimonadales bacterium]|nr:GNAT family N-acetyltransferase [Gemmatimonadales bacterium]